MGETRRERLLFQMIVNLGTGIAEIQETLLGLADSPAFEDSQKVAVLQHSELLAVQIQELMARAREYQLL